jgi:copper transport protein
MTPVENVASATAFTVPPLWRILTQFGYFAGLSGAIGSTMTFAAVVRPALRGAGVANADRVVLRRRAAGCLAWSGVLLLVAGYFQLAARVARAGAGMPFGQALGPGRIWHFLRMPAAPGAWMAQGTVYLAQNAVLLLASAALISLFGASGRNRLDRFASIALPLTLAVTVVGAIPVSGPESADDLVDTLLTQVHIISGTVWVGGLVVLAVLAAGARRSLSDEAGVLWADLWRRFGLVALVCVGAVLTSGLWLTWKHVGAVGQLWTTGYGLFLLVKICLVLGMVAAGAVNQFWLMPRIARARQADETASLRRLTLRHFPQVVWGEVALATGVLAIVPFLSGSARAQAGHGPAPAADAGVFTLGTVLVLTLAASLYATARTSDALARRLTTE